MPGVAATPDVDTAIPHQEIPPHRPHVAGPLGGNAGSDPAGRRVRVVVLEPSNVAPVPDRLDDEFDVAVRLAVPARADDVGTVLAQVRPGLLLLKHSLETIDERLMATCMSFGVEIMVLARPVYGLLRAPTMRRFGGLPWIRLRSGAGRPAANGSSGSSTSA
ncbi:hypothetical protein GCM10027614_04830 [Micromonospora vulcania]